MILYLTSSPFIDGAKRPVLNPANDFLHRIRADLPECPRCVYIASSADDHQLNREFASHVFIAFRDAGIHFSSFDILDSRTSAFAAELIARSDLIVLAGGHVPTQNRFFHRIGLAGLLTDYEGVILGISAGSMNCAGTVYAQPEAPGESEDPHYQRFVPGLGLTHVNICPHYQKVRYMVLDGKRLFEDITYRDSMGKTFYALPDGSYFYIHGEETLLCGEAFRLRNGIPEMLTFNGEAVHLSDFE